MRRADEQPVLAAEELPRRPVEAPARMRADVEPGTHLIAFAVKHERLGLSVDDGLDPGEPAIREPIKPQQWPDRPTVTCVSV